MVLLSGSDPIGYFVGPGLPARSPQHNKVAILESFQAEDREVGRLDLVAMLQQLALHLVEQIVGQPFWRKYRPARVVTVLPDNNVATSQVLEVVGKRADRAQDRVGVPARLVLDAFPFHGALAEQRLYVYREFGIHTSSGFLPCTFFTSASISPNLP